MANLIDRIVQYVSPSAALKREHARRILAYYEAGRSDRLRKNRRETGSGNAAVSRAGSTLRQQARHMEQNYDIALGVLNTLVANVVGANGIGVEPQPRRADGSIHDEYYNWLYHIYRICKTAILCDGALSGHDIYQYADSCSTIVSLWLLIYHSFYEPGWI